MIGSVFAGQLLGNTENLHQPAVTVEMDDAGIIGIRNIQIAVLIHKHTAGVFKWILFRPRIDTIHHALGIRTQNAVITGIHDIQIALRTDKQILRVVQLQNLTLGRAEGLPCGFHLIYRRHRYPP